jgi:hypothetical protein
MGTPGTSPLGTRESNKANRAPFIARSLRDEWETTSLITPQIASRLLW